MQSHPIIKFFLHISKNEQRERFLERIDAPEKNWKFGSADVEERQYWDDYMEAYEDCLGATSSSLIKQSTTHYYRVLRIEGKCISVFDGGEGYADEGVANCQGVYAD